MNFKSLGAKLNIAFLTALVLPLTLTTVFAVGYVSDRIEKSVLREISTDMDVVSWIVDHEARMLEDLVRSRSTHSRWANLVELGEYEKLEAKLSRDSSALSVDEILVVDLNSEIKAHSRPLAEGATPSANRSFTAPALAGHTASGLELITPPGDDPSRPPMLSVTASAPLYDEQNLNVTAAVVARRYIGQKKHFLSSAYSVLHFNLCVYASNRLIVGSPPAPAEFRTLKPAVEAAVLGQAVPYTEVVDGDNGYIALYEPVLSASGEPIGAFMTRRDALDTILLRRKVFIAAFGITLLGLLLTAAIKMVIERSILLPIAALQRGTRMLANGDYSNRLEEQSRDEIGDLTRSFNQMATALRESHEKLEEYSRSLAGSEALFRAVVQDQSELISRSMPDGTLVFVNEAYSRCFDAESPGRKEKNFWEHVYEQDREMVRTHLDSLSPENPVTVIEDRNVTPDGRIAWMQWVVRGMFDEEGTLTGYQSVGRDMTDRRLVEESLRTLNEKLIEEHDQRKFLSRKLMELLEMDRRRISMELHDHIGQILTTLKMDLEFLAGHLDGSGRDLSRRIGMALEKSVQAMRGIKEIACDLRPSVLDDLGLVASINNLIEEVRLRTDVEFHFFHRNIPRGVGSDRQTTIYRVVQEALNNVLKHSGAKKVFINLVRRNHTLWLSVEDDGAGFDPLAAMEHQQAENSMGLLIIRERVAQVDGEFSIESRKGAGTHLLVEIPLS